MRYFMLIFFVLSTFALAQPPSIVHTETINVGPYSLEVGFSRWPLQADKSLDFTFKSVGGIADKSGTVTMIPPEGRPVDPEELELWSLSRYARDRNVWGIDVFALNAQGQWTFEFEIDGPQGKGTGSLGVVVLERPAFLPPLVNWSIAFLPLIGLVTLISTAWRRAKVGKRAETWTWGDTM
jgi:hypothetical protein